MSKERAAQLVDAGIWLKLSGDREGARKLFERALKLDPENQKAAQLLAGGEEPPPPAPEFAPSDVVAPPIAPVSSSPSSPPVNPFEPPAASPPSVNERDWEIATRKPAPPPVEPSLDADWGRLTGASTPIPQAAPPGSEPAATKSTLPAWGSSPSSTIRIGSNTPAPAKPPGPTSSPSQPKNPTMMQWNSPVPQSSPSGQKKQTMSEWGTQPGVDSPPPIRPADLPADLIAPVVPMVISGESSTGSSPSSSGKQTLSAWGKPGTPAPGTEIPISSGSGQKRQTMSDWGTQVGGSFDSPPPIRPVIPIEDMPPPPAPPPVEVPRSTLHEWGGSSGSSGNMQPLFSGPASSESSPMMQEPGGMTVRIGGDAGPDVPPPSTPPLYTGNPAEYRPEPPVFSGSRPSEPPTPAQMDELPLPGAAPMAEIPRTTTEPMGFAWSWSASASPPPGAPPEPRPSPSLAPRADSAWDQRSNPGIKLEAVVGRDKALDLIASDSKITRAPPTKKEEIQTILRGAKDLLELDDHTGAMELIRKAESIAPDDPEVIAMRDRSEKTLLTMFESKLGKLEAIPRVLLKDDEIIWLNLDHRAGFVLAQIDGTVTFDDLFSVSGMTRIDTARILAQLVEEGVISRG